MKVYQKITDLIGGTPLLELTNLEAEDGLPARSTASWNISIRLAASGTESPRA